MTEKEITDFEPHIEAEVNSSGMLYVGRKYQGKKTWIYFLKDDENAK